MPPFRFVHGAAKVAAAVLADPRIAACTRVALMLQ